MAQLQASTVAGTLTTTGNVGVGTNTLGAELHVKGTSTEQILISYDNTKRMLLGRASGYGWIAPYTSGVSYDNLVLVRDGGNVGIGNTTVLGKLDVGLSTNVRRFLVTYDDSIVTIKSSNNSSNPENFRLVGDTIIFNTGTTGSGTEKMRITDGGNVGIGTGTPEAKLDVRAGAGFIRLGSYNDNYYVKIEGGDQLNFRNGANAAVAYIQYAGPADSLIGRNLYIEGNSSGGTTGAVRIKSDGNVGIGTATPTQKLQVEGVTRSNGVYIPGLYTFGQSQSGIEMQLASTSYNAIRFYQGSDYTGVIHSFGRSWGGGASVGMINIEGYNGVTIGAWNLTTSTTTTFLANGNVGIGQASPVAYLDIRGRADISGLIPLQLRAGNSASNFSSNQITLAYDNTAEYRHAIKTRHQSGGPSGNAIDFYTWLYGSASTSIGGQHVMSLDGANVGIGATTPTRKLDVQEGNIQIVANFQNTSTTSSRIKFTDANTGAENVNIGATGTSLAMWTNNTVRMTILSGGNVGIGTVTPTQRLQVEGAIVGGAAGSSGTPNLTGITTQIAFEARTTTAGNEPSIAYHREGDYTFYLQGQETPRGLRLYGPSNETAPSLFVAGNVGIGTTAPTHKLDVRGTLRVDSSTSFATEYAATPNAIIGNKQDEKCLGAPDDWLAINVSGTDYAIPLFSLG